MERLGKYQMIIVRRLTKDYTKSMCLVSKPATQDNPFSCGSGVFEYNFANFVKVTLAKLRWCLQKKRAISYRICWAN